MSDLEPLTGDPRALESAARRLSDFAEKLAAADDFLRNTAGGEFASSSAKSIEALRERGESIGSMYSSASSQYLLCAQGIARYAMTLEWVQREMAPIVERYNELAQYDVWGGPGAQLNQDLPDDMSMQDIREEKEQLRADYGTLKEAWREAFREAAMLVGAGIQLSEPELDEPTTLEKVLDWLAIGGTILAIVGFWWSPAGWAAAAAGAGTLGIQGYRFSQGEAGWGDLAAAGVGVIPFGRFYKIKALPDGSGYQIVPGKGVNFAKTSGMSDEALDSFAQLSPQTQLLLTGAAYGDVKNTFDGLVGGLDAAGNIIYRNRDTGEIVEFDGLVEPPPPKDRGPMDRSAHGSAR